MIQSITIALSTPSIVQVAHDTRRLATLASGAAASPARSTARRAPARLPPAPETARKPTRLAGYF